jgi:pilus assembly protein CpaB
MRRTQILAVVLALGSGLAATVGVHAWLDQQAARARLEARPLQQIPMTRIVVAREDLAFGAEVARPKLQEVEWPAANVPEGVYKSIGEIFTEQQSRVVLEALRAKEPVLRGKISGPGQRAGLASMLTKGMKAVSIRVNEVIGVGGFVLPGDRVDVLLTREIKLEKTKDQTANAPVAYTDLLIENMRVLAIDQVADPKTAVPKIGRTVTVEASIENAQRLTLAATVGTLSLILREVSTVEPQSDVRRVDVADLDGDSGDKQPGGAFMPTAAVAPAPPTVKQSDADTVKIRVVRAVKSTDYSVKSVAPSR